MRKPSALLGFIVCMTLCIAAGNALDAAPDKPNIIFIMADDAGYGDFGCFGSKAIHTPNIDQLAREGTRFTQAYSGSTVCAPARSTLMTGQHTGHTTVRHNMNGKHGVDGPNWDSGLVPLKEEDVTVAEVLKQAGYKTGVFGKWGLGEPGTTGHPLDQGFDRWFGYLNQVRAHTYYTDYLWSNRKKVQLEDGTYSHYTIEKQSLNFIHNNADEPFFVYLGYTLPHAKFTIPKDDPAYQRYRDRDWTDKERNFAAMVTRFDASVGKVVSLLEKRGIREETLIFVTSDNGSPNKEFLDEPLDSNGPLRGLKRDMYEGGIRVPMVVSWPGQVPAGETSSLPWYFPDVLPTAAEVAGVSGRVPDNVDGVSILPALLGNDEPQLRNRLMYWEFMKGGFRQAIRIDRWKAVRHKADEPIELYNLRKDPGESSDVADQHPDLVSRFERLFVEARTPSRNWPTPLDNNSNAGK